MNPQFKESLPVELTDEELLEHGAAAAKAREKMSSIEADHKVAKEAYKDDLSFLESKLKRHLQAISAGEEDRQVLCEWQLDVPTMGSKALVRLDTGETVREAAMEGEDLQGALPLLPEPEAV